MQHWSIWPEYHHEVRARALRSGWQIGQEGDTPRGPFIYFLNEGHPGTIVEIAEATPTRMRIFDQVRDAALGYLLGLVLASFDQAFRQKQPSFCGAAHPPWRRPISRRQKPSGQSILSAAR